MSRTAASGVAARIETTAFACGAISSATAASWPGLWQRTTRSASRQSACQVPAADQSDVHEMCRLTTTRAGRVSTRPGSSGLIEEALLDQPRSLLGGDLDGAGGEHEDLVGDALHAPVERVGEARGEVDEALCEVGVRALEVEDHGDPVLELVGDLLGVGEGLGHHDVPPHVVVPKSFN